MEPGRDLVNFQGKLDAFGTWEGVCGNNGDSKRASLACCTHGSFAGRFGDRKLSQFWGAV